ncbi:hypothetical protein SAY87_029349 [Trapa incisa]|uniref:Uncharacterized protein n=1 Tax=Trapa incisa TaxID=236973 RepID=A0AAN7QD09_9MYRT|nr:hypothetical protein SAY87_029349 [Trapa incisa]
MVGVHLSHVHILEDPMVSFHGVHGPPSTKRAHAQSLVKPASQPACLLVPTIKMEERSPGAVPLHGLYYQCKKKSIRDDNHKLQEMMVLNYPRAQQKEYSRKARNSTENVSSIRSARSNNSTTAKSI